jgi:hypothetical protein
LGEEGNSRFPEAKVLVLSFTARAIGSGVEHILHTDGVAGSNPASPTIELQAAALWRRRLLFGCLFGDVLQLAYRGISER